MATSFSKLFRRSLGLHFDPVIVPYRGFGNKTTIFLKGCVVESASSVVGRNKNSRISNFLATLKRYIGKRLPHVHLEVSFAHITRMLETDEDGYFELWLPITEVNLKPDYEWHTVEYTLKEPNLPQSQVTGEVLIPKRTCHWAVISDIDDTILISHSTETLRKLRLMLMKNASTRLPFHGVAQFYQALHYGKNEGCYNPIFYVSSSEWNLYDMLIDFFRYRSIPNGPLLLRDLDHSIFKFWKSGKGNHDHKLAKVKQLIHCYPHLSFILIGDSGQQDPELYLELVKAYPEQIETIYIRDVTNQSRQQEVKGIAAQAENYGVTMLLVEDTTQAARHAAQAGYIKENALQQIQESKPLKPISAGL